ncbi:MAG: trk system potassium uptake protein TrkH [Chlamydiales bacterium]|jgi:trk system potassium uptake protein TrkH
MSYREISRVIGQYLFYFSILLLIPLCIAAYYEFMADPELHPQPHSTLAFFFSAIISATLSLCFRVMGARASGTLYRREALAIVVMIWFISALLGGIPFYLSKTFENPVDCYFEAMSGLTTTGASVMHPKAFDSETGEEIAYNIKDTWGWKDPYVFYGTINPVRDPKTGAEIYRGIEAVGRAVLFWRSFLQWLGGMGIVVLFIAVLPALGVGGKVLFQAEVPGPTKDAVTPRIRETAGVLWKLYLGFTIVEVLLLMYTNENIDLFNAVAITFSNLSTGGFSVRNASIGAYESATTEWIVMSFMLLGSINFALYFHCLKGKIYRLYEPEFIAYIVSILIGSLIVIWHLIGIEKNLLTGETGIFSSGEAIRYGAFHLISAQTSTGYVTANFDAWPSAVQVLMLMVMFVGSMSGSTGGGIKIVRHYMLLRIAKNKVESIFRPETVRTLRIGNQEVDQNVANTVLTFFFIVVSLTALGTFLLVMDGVDPETSLGINACMINNIGMAFRVAGPTGSFAFLSSFGKILSSIWMVLGRLEFFALLIVLVPAFWRGK